MPLTWVTEWDAEEKTIIWRQGERHYAKELCNEQNKPKTHKRRKKKITPTREAACLKEPRNSELPMIAQLSLNIPVTCRAKTYKHAGISWKKFQGSVVNINHDLTHLHLTVPKAVHGITTGHSPVSFLVGYVSIRGLEMQSQYIP